MRLAWRVAMLLVAQVLVVTGPGSDLNKVRGTLAHSTTGSHYLTLTERASAAGRPCK